MPLPDFLVIGGMKCGTTSLHDNLKFHPDIGMTLRKEPNFFSVNSKKGISWYKRQFEENKIKFGDASPSYSWLHLFPETPKLIVDTVPDVKLIYIVRDPMERIISHLHHDLYRDRLKLSEIDVKVLADSHYISTSQYAFQLEGYLKFFENSKIQILDMSELKSDMDNTLNKICSFIGVASFDFNPFLKVTNQSSEKYLIKKHDFVHEYLPENIAKIYHSLFYLYGKKIDRPVLREETLKKIKIRLHPDVECFKNLSKMNFENWDFYNKV